MARPVKVLRRLLARNDTSTELGRSQERDRRAVLTGLTMAAAKVVSIATALISVPITVTYLGTERYGMWMTINSFHVLMMVADAGVGRGVIASIAGASGAEDHAAARRSISTAAVILGSAAALIIVALLASYSLVPWPQLFGVTTDLARREAGPAAAVFVICVALGMPLDLVQRVQMGKQSGFSAGIWRVVGSLLGLTGLLCAVHLEAGLPWLVLAVVGGPVLSVAGNWVQEFHVSHPHLAPHLRYASWGEARAILCTGGMFSAQSAASAAAFATDSIVLAQLVGPSAVSHYAVPMRLFGLLLLARTFIAEPLFPAYNEAQARSDNEWMSRALKRSSLLVLALPGSAAAALVLCGPWLIHQWIDGSFPVDRLVLFAMAVWAISRNASGTLMVFVNGVGAVRLQTWMTVATGVVALAAKIVGARMYGVAGLLFGTTIATMACLLVPQLVFVASFLRRSRPDAAPSTRARSEADLAAP